MALEFLNILKEKPGKKTNSFLEPRQLINEETPFTTDIRNKKSYYFTYYDTEKKRYFVKFQRNIPIV